MELIPTIPLHLGPAKIGQEKPTDVLFPGLGNILNIVWKVGLVWKSFEPVHFK